MSGRPTITIPEQLNRQAVLDVVQALDNTRLRFEPNSLMRMQADAALKPVHGRGVEMRAVTPIVPGCDLPIVVYAKDQPEYLQLPAYKADDGMVITRWRFSWTERLRLLVSGDMWLYVLTFNGPLQPVRLDTKAPEVSK